MSSAAFRRDAWTRIESRGREPELPSTRGLTNERRFATGRLFDRAGRRHDRPFALISLESRLALLEKSADALGLVARRRNQRAGQLIDRLFTRFPGGGV